MKTYKETLNERLEQMKRIADMAKAFENVYGYFSWTDFLNNSFHKAEWDKLYDNRGEMMEVVFANKEVVFENIDTDVFNYFIKAPSEKYSVYNKTVLTEEDLIFQYNKVINYGYLETQNLDAKLFNRLRNMFKKQDIDLIELLKDGEEYRNDIRLIHILNSKEVEEIRAMCDNLTNDLSNQLSWLDDRYFEILGIEPFFKRD